MAGLAAVSVTVFVIDTSYLVELYKVPCYFDEAHHTEVRARFVRAVDAKNLLFVPFPVVFEVANHIVDGGEEGSRDALAKRFVGDVLSSFEKAVPFVITPPIDEDHLKALLRLFAEHFAKERIGLTDTSIIEEARRLKKKYGGQAKVHIWTLDKRLKAREPDREPHPFVG